MLTGRREAGFLGVPLLECVALGMWGWRGVGGGLGCGLREVGQSWEVCHCVVGKSGGW